MKTMASLLCQYEASARSLNAFNNVLVALSERLSHFELHNICIMERMDGYMSSDFIFSSKCLPVIF